MILSNNNNTFVIEKKSIPHLQPRVIRNLRHFDVVLVLRVQVHSPQTFHYDNIKELQNY